MPFPKEGTEFPPTDYRGYYNKITEWAAWYSGDPEQLLHLYSSSLFFPETSEGLFWSRIEREERAGILHLPLAGDISSTSANLLFSEVPEFRYDKKGPGGDRITDFLQENGFNNILLEAAELAAAMSGAFLKLDIDPDLIQLPIVSIITPLQAIPYFRRGWLTEVLFFRTVREEKEGLTKWRLFELRHRDGDYLKIEYKLYKGTKDRVGREVGLESIDETAELGLTDIAYRMPGLACVYIPNMRPNRIMPGSPIGINDFNGGIITMMDSLDFAWTSWMRDLELGMAQIMVDEDLLEKPEGGIITQDTSDARLRFNKFQKAFIKLNLAPWRMGGENVKPIEQIQFDIRVDAHLRTCEALIYNIVSQCGYSPQTFGLSEGGRISEASGTALRIRERKSLLTREKKSRYWQPQIALLLWQMQLLDVRSGLAPKSHQAQKVDVELQDSIIVEERDQSETIRNLDMAKAVSVYTKVKMLHPEWAEEDVEAEVQRISDEQGMTPSPFDIDLQE